MFLDGVAQMMLGVEVILRDGVEKQYWEGNWGSGVMVSGFDGGLGIDGGWRSKMHGSGGVMTTTDRFEAFQY